MVPKAILHIKVKPNQPETKIISQDGDNLVIAVSEPAERGRANRELLKFLKKHFKANNVEILSGISAHKKVVRIS